MCKVCDLNSHLVIAFEVTKANMEKCDNLWQCYCMPTSFLILSEKNEIFSTFTKRTLQFWKPLKITRLDYSIFRWQFTNHTHTHTCHNTRTGFADMLVSVSLIMWENAMVFQLGRCVCMGWIVFIFIMIDKQFGSVCY